VGFIEDKEAEKRPRRKITRWQALFPFHWDADAFVMRRDLLRLAVQASGAFFAVTAGLAGLGTLWPRKARGARRPIIEAAKLKPGDVHYFSYPTEEDPAMLLRLKDGKFVAYSGRCTHLSCAVYYSPKKEQLICPCHDGCFEARSGVPLAGPPQRPLPRVVVQEDGGMIYAIEEQPR
jgi:Rieske Fe-S protein